MDEQQITTAMNSDPMVKFAGVFSSDEVPENMKTGYFYIFNTAPSHDPGEHWIAVYNADPIECFDSISDKDTRKQFKSILGDAYLFNNIPVQSSLSITCGHHCLFYIFLRCRGIAFDDIINLLHGWDNDEFVISFIRGIYGPAVSTISML